ncbi:MAG: hypothetical protein ACE5HI_09745 [bacterium]
MPSQSLFLISWFSALKARRNSATLGGCWHVTHVNTKGEIEMNWLKKLFGGGRDKDFTPRVVDDLRDEKERNMERQAKSSLSGEDEQLARKMVSLIQQCNSLEDAAAKEMKKIGEYLCSNGGHDRMVLVAYRVQALGKRVRDCELYWDGICGWMY